MADSKPEGKCEINGARGGCVIKKSMKGWQLTNANHLLLYMPALLWADHLHGDRDDDLALRGAVTRDVAGERVDVRDQLRLLGRRRRAAHAAAKADGLAGHLAHEGPQDEAVTVRVRVKDVEACVEGRTGVLLAEVQPKEEQDGTLNIPAQFTSLLGDGRLLYACHSKEAVFARLLRRRGGGSAHVNDSVRVS